MGVERRTLDNNGQAPERLSYGLLDHTGWSVDTNGNATFGGDVTIGGKVTAASGLAVPNAYGVAGATMDILQASAGQSLSAGLMWACIAAVAAGPINYIGTWLTVAGATSTGQNKMGLYRSDGTQVDLSVDMTGVFTGAAGMIEGALSLGEYEHPGGPLYIVVLTHMTSAPTIGGSGGTAANMPPYNGILPSVYDFGITSLPANLSPATHTRNNASFFAYVR